MGHCLLTFQVRFFFRAVASACVHLLSHEQTAVLELLVLFLLLCLVLQLHPFSFHMACDVFALRVILRHGGVIVRFSSLHKQQCAQEREHAGDTHRTCTSSSEPKEGAHEQQ